ncbi:MAG: acetyltransferase [Anaerolineae bacterium]|nr:acetyltransferase [Anaerolineae bacterium]
MKRVVGVGAGGHAKVMLSILRAMGGYEVVGLLDPDRALWNIRVSGAVVLGDDDLLPELLAQNVTHVFIGLGTVGNTQPRRRLYEHVKQMGFTVVVALHPLAIIDSTATLGDGLTVAAGAIISTEARLGNNVLINTGAIIEHDCVIEDHVHVATGAQLAGGIHVGAGTHIGIGAHICQSLHIGRNAIVGAGAVVIDDVPDNVVVVGVPARTLRERV